jgi:hypothetical protein
MWERTSIDKRCFPKTQRRKVFAQKTLRIYSDDWARGFAEKKEADEPYVNSSALEPSKNGFRGFLQAIMLSGCLENSVNSK